MKSSKQTTLGGKVTLSGIGVHSNRPARIILHPAHSNSGIVFLRTGLEDGGDRKIQALWSKVSMTDLCTVIGDPSRAAVSTIEHLMAAFSGMGVDNVIVEIDGPEMPIMDGSARPFVEAIDQVGLVTLAAPRRHLKILKTVRVERGRAFSELRPSAQGFRLDVEIDFDAEVIGRQRKVVDLEPGKFRKDIAAARTFGFVHQVEQLWKAGFALGSSLENSVALDGNRILNPEGLRFADEFVRHKMLDAVGDLALAGAPIIGTYQSYCGGHKMNVSVLEALFADTTAYTFVEANAPQPVVRQGLHADIGMVAAAPDLT
ncbi:UDP-3-O-acyl-N-acetylglucosamine deacetylase [Methylovirgula sp. 4M-Z18]|uniref:UDP-3-O-acyl-N-acetylglucosamine deacetylase n=1 Tax=Methylovirgula sp. 4M-Z18 TaxID=2293567 RepID=UPI000E2EB243|nr:UDP-3-O-acyl-N-acetylglucosamine deacetylase [Methylovirgula sp. 4M-Z18]RFB79605.1 UDP-3-O-acyl-N-acetylglucosamine deacetylase [Methylovirgula sp. 4M-Z18]